MCACTVVGMGMRMEVDLDIIDQIERMRAEFHACTMRAVANRMQLSPTWVTQRLEAMRADGLVDWTAVPGSLHVVQAATDVPDAPVVKIDGRSREARALRGQV